VEARRGRLRLRVEEMKTRSIINNDEAQHSGSVCGRWQRTIRRATRRGSDGDVEVLRGERRGENHGEISEWVLRALLWLSK